MGETGEETNGKKETCIDTMYTGKEKTNNTMNIFLQERIMLLLVNKVSIYSFPTFLSSVKQDGWYGNYSYRKRNLYNMVSNSGARIG